MRYHKIIATETPAKLHGFTIVELLIVIVVIGILASISVVAYINIQEKANASKAAITASNYAKIFELYRQKNGSYPSPSHNGISNTVCLGKPSDYPEDDTFEEGECAKWSYSSLSNGNGGSSDTTYSHQVSQDFNDDVTSTALTSLPSANLRTVGASNISGSTVNNEGEDYEYTTAWSTSAAIYRGVTYTRYTDYDSNSEAGYISYFLNGTQECGKGETFHYSNITECAIELGGSSSGYGYVPQRNGGEGYYYDNPNEDD